MAIIDASLYEPIDVVVTADTTAYTADNATSPTADGGVLIGAVDVVDGLVGIGADVIEAAAAVDDLDAEVISVPVVVEGGGIQRPLKPLPVEGRGYGVLPQLEGEAFGAVGIVGDAVGKLPRLGGAADGSVGVAGRSAGQIVIRGAAIGDCGQVGTADAVFKGLSIASDGAVGVRGSGVGMIEIKATGRGRHDDDEAAVLTFLLAA